MPFPAENLTQNWPMSFQSVHFLLFLPLVTAGYFLVPHRARRAFLLLASYWFYFFAAPSYLPVLLLGTLLSYALGRFIAAGASGTRGGRLRAPGASQAHAVKDSRTSSWRLAFSVAAMLLFLCLFKYFGLFAPLLSGALARLGMAQPAAYFETAKALGISFYTFSSLAYLIDVARGDAPVEKNLLNYALYLGFFPSVLQGPIGRPARLLPQLKAASVCFSPARAASALRLMAIGFFKKLAVANTLGIFTAQIYEQFVREAAALQGFTLTLAALAFAAQLYFDFSGYTDIARGAAEMLGINLPQNFQNPYFSTNFSAFWARWHMSLSSFLQDYVFTPLVWSRFAEKLPLIGKRVTKPPVLTAIFVTFLLSGLWHGDSLPYLVWGLLMAAYRIGEELLHRRLGKPKKNPKPALRLAKQVAVLALWTESLVFFKMGMTKGGSVAAAGQMLLRQFYFARPGMLWQNILAAVKDGFYNDNFLAACFIAFALVCLATALWADWFQAKRLRGGSLADALGALPGGRRRAAYLLLTLCCFAGFILVSGGYGGASFLYGGY